MEKVISFDLKAEFGFLKKPFSNEKLDLYLTFNMLHKPALLGILGAIAGLKGFKENGKLPEYYEKLNDTIRVGIEPLEESNKKYHEKGMISKTSIKYNNSVGYASREEGGNLIVHEQVLINPAFRCYLLLNEENETHLSLYNKIKNVEAEYLPYWGKNEFSAWWEKESVLEYDFIDISKGQPESIYRISSIFFHTDFKNEKGEIIFDILNMEENFTYFERLPVEYEKVENSFQYKLYKTDKEEKFVYSNFPVKGSCNIKNLYKLTSKETKQTSYVQFF